MPPRGEARWFAVAGVALLLAVLRIATFHLGALERADQLVFAGFAGFHRPRGVYHAATILAGVSGPAPFLGLAAVVVLVAVLRARWALVVAVLALLGGANLTTELLKRLTAAARFSGVPGGRLPSATAWPSGHATAAASLVLACVIVSPRRWRRHVAAGGSAFFLTMAYAFMTLRWHYESDVLGGLGVASAWALLVVAGLGSRGRRASPAGTGVVPLMATATATWVLLVALAWPYLLRYADSRAAFVAGTGFLAGCTVVAVGSVARACERPAVGRDFAKGAERVRSQSRRRQPAEAEQLPS